MAQLSSGQAIEFSDDLDTIGLAIGTIRQGGVLSNGQSLTSQQKDYLLSCQIQLLRSSATFSTQAITLNGDTIKDQLTGLAAAAKTIDRALARIQETQKIMDIAAAAVGVVSSVATGNGVSVAESLEKLVGEISAGIKG
jgi:hypothetical protein